MKRQKLIIHMGRGRNFRGEGAEHGKALGEERAWALKDLGSENKQERGSSSVIQDFRVC